MQQKATVAQVRQVPEICLEGLTESTKEPQINRCHDLEIWHFQNTNQKLRRMSHLFSWCSCCAMKLYIKAIVIVQ